MLEVVFYGGYWALIDRLARKTVYISRDKTKVEALKFRMERSSEQVGKYNRVKA